MRLYCIRHGESIFNAQGRIQGQRDVALSDLGRRQGMAVARALAGQGVEVVYSSPLVRALDTARLIGDALDVEVIRDARLMEIHAGIFQELRWDEVSQLYPDEAARWKSHDPDFVIPRGESRRQLASRAAAVFADIRRLPLKRVAVVAHGGLFAAAFKSLLEIPLHKSPFGLFNASISQLDWDEEPQLVTLNQVDHLREVELGGLLHRGDL